MEDLNGTVKSLTRVPYRRGLRPGGDLGGRDVKVTPSRTWSDGPS